MTPFKDIVIEFPGILMRTIQMILILVQLFLCISSFRRKRSILIKTLAILHLALGTFIWILMLDGTFRVDTRLAWPALVNIFYNAPWLIIVCLELVSAALVIYFGAESIYFAGNQILPSAIKESLDLLPTGVAFGREDGTAELVNLKMNEYARNLYGSELYDVNEFWSQLGQRILRPEDLAAGTQSSGSFREMIMPCHPERCEGSFTEDNKDKKLLSFPDGRALIFARDILNIDGQTYSQITAVDETEIFRITKELQDKNSKLKDIQLRMKALSVEASDVVIDQEILNARAAVHDELGQVLLSAKYYFDNPDRVDTDALYQMMRNANTYLLREAEEPDTVRDEYLDAVKMASGIGVETEVSGQVPENAVLRDIFAQIIRACSANTVKHAEGDRVYLNIKEISGEYSITVTNNGLLPRGTINETGGLAALRRTVEDCGGGMNVISSPAFKLIITLPKTV